MARYYKRLYSYRFRSYRKSSRRWRNFSKYNYNNVKLDVNFHVQYPTQNGEPVILFGVNTFAKYYTIGSLMNDHSDWTSFKPLYQFFKLKGLRFECTPMSCNAGGDGIIQSSGVYLGWCLTQVGSDQSNTKWLTETERAVVLNPLQRTVKYWSTYGMQDDWKTIATNLGGNISVYSDETATLNTAPVWHVKVTLYVACKMANK